jgi:hypothetical protein
MDGSSRAKISEDTVSYFNKRDDWLYYTNDSDGKKLNRISYNSPFIRNIQNVLHEYEKICYNYNNYPICFGSSSLAGKP